MAIASSRSTLVHPEVKAKEHIECQDLMSATQAGRFGHSASPITCAACQEMLHILITQAGFTGGPRNSTVARLQAYLTYILSFHLV